MIQITPPNTYAGVPLDRAHLLRGDPDGLATALADDDVWVLPLWRAMNYVSTDPQSPRLVTCRAKGPWPEPPIFLGLIDRRPVFAVDLSAVDEPDHHPALVGLAGRFAELRSVGPLMSRDEASILGYARAIVWWNARNHFCGVCGGPTQAREAGFMRQCVGSCGAQHFPRTDPAVIMLVHDGADRVIMARQRVWGTGMHSILAGYVEPGECLEDAVAREVMEEVGVKVTDIRYQSSQPWPFPASLMLGFTARAVTFDLNVDTNELETAKWVDRDYLRHFTPSDSFCLPRTDSIAYRLLTAWIADQHGG